jgi:predicted nuclease of predicted toxin-antitoxin system
LPSIIIFRLSNMRPENVNAHLAIVLERHANNLEEGAVLAVSERRIRVRRLPI